MMWSFVDFLPKVYWDCKPKLTESLNELLYNETRTGAWDTYLQHLKESYRAAVHQLVPQLYKLARWSRSILYWP